MKKLIVGCLLFFSISVLNAQDVDTLPSDDIKYKVSYADKLGLYLYGISKYSNFQLKEEGQKNDSVLRYSPNGNFNIGAGFSYKWFGFGLALNIGAINNDNELKGKTSSLDLQLDIFSRKLFFSGNFQYYKGYYWNNPEVFFSDWNKKDSLVVRPDISTITMGLNGIYLFNHKKFSFRAAYQYNERQLKSAGSMLLGSRFSIYGIEADSSIVPNQLHGLYPNSTNIGSLSSMSFGVSFGYTYTLVFGKYFFVNALLMTGINGQALGIKDLNDEVLKSTIQLSNNITFRIAIGFNKPKVYYGMNFIADSFLLRNPNNTELSYNYGKFRIYYGRRFNI